MKADRSSEQMAHGTAHRGGTATPAGLAVAWEGYRLVAERAELRRGETAPFTFRIVGPGERSVTDYDEVHERRMHLIVVRRDLSGFQHLHPDLQSDGTWVTPLTLRSAGSWRAFADFSTEGNPHTLGIDLAVGGGFIPEPLPEPNTVVRAGSHIVQLRSIQDGDGTMLRFTVDQDGRVLEVEPYLGANGHLVALRVGDLAFLHVHPRTDARADEISFAIAYPSLGRYRLFLQYAVEGSVSMAPFTVDHS
jgi:hypothetical protein